MTTGEPRPEQSPQEGLHIPQGACNDPGTQALYGIARTMGYTGLEQPAVPGREPLTQDEQNALGRLAVAELAQVLATEQQLGDFKSAYYVVENGVTRPCDPGTGEVLGPGQIPPSMLQDPACRRGIEFLSDHGSKIRMRQLLTEHVDGHSHRKFGIDLRAEAERLHAAGGVLYVEGTQSQKVIAAMRELLNHASQLQPSQFAAFLKEMQHVVQKDPLFGYSASVVEAIMGTNVDVETIDYAEDGHRDPEITLNTMRQMLDVGQGDMFGFVHRARMRLSFTHYRDSYWMAQIGEDLRRRAAQGSPVFDITLKAGATHENVGHRIGAFGAEVTMVGDEEALPLGNKRFVRSVANARIDPADYLAYIGLINN